VAGLEGTGDGLREPVPAVQPLHLLAQRRLHDVLPLRRPAEMQLLGQRHEITELAQLMPAAKPVPGTLSLLAGTARIRSPEGITNFC
jgi:hypothetical protein